MMPTRRRWRHCARTPRLGGQTCEVERRDQALLALLLLTAMRDAAVVGLKLKHISVERSHVFQDPREIKTKFRKPIETTFLPVGKILPPSFATGSRI
jgi:integrase